MELEIAIVGAGHWGPNLIRNLSSNPRSNVRWVIDASDDRRAQVAQRFPGVRTGSDLTEALADDAVGAVVVATPTKTHFDIVSKALEAGRHVFVEKPLAASLEEGVALAELAERVDRRLFVGHVFLFNGAVRFVHDVIGRGDLGDLCHITMARTNLGPVRVDVNAAWDLASHDISILNQWLGALPAQVSAVGGAWLNPGVADAIFATLSYESGVIANLHVSWLNPRKGREVTVVGTQRMLVFDDLSMDEPVRIYDRGVHDAPPVADLADSFVAYRTSIRDGAITIPRVPFSEPLKAECDHFVDHVLDGGPAVSSAKVGLDVLRVLDAIDRSVAAGGAPVSLA
jgi:predicted dehydrogenase